MSLIGTLSEIKLADVLRLFAAGTKTGLLTASTPGRPEAFIRFQKGAIVHAAAGRLQGDDAILDVFGWKEGQLTFVPEEKTVTPNVTHGVDVLILEGSRLGEAFHRMNELIPHDRVVFHMAASPPDGAQYTVGAAEWRVLRQLDGVRDVREVTEGAQLPRADVVRILFALAEAGFLQRAEVTKTLRAVAQGLFGKDSAELDGRFRDEWMTNLRFAGGVHRVEVRTLTRSLLLGASFRPGLIRDVYLPRTALAELGLREGEDVFVRPVG